jgi:hypothetical protein
VRALERIQSAGLWPIVERVAAQNDVKPAALLVVSGRVSGAQTALFRALATEGRDAHAISSLLGWGEAAVARELTIPEPAPTPPPQSGVRKIARPAKNATLEAEVRILKREVRSLKSMIGVLSGKLYTVVRRAEGSDGDARHVLRAVAREHRVTAAALLGATRTGKLVRARRDFIRRLIEELLWPHRRIAKFMGRDRTTIAYHASVRRKAA